MTSFQSVDVRTKFLSERSAQGPILVFCPVQNVSFAPGVREIDLDYGAAGSVLFLVPNPLTLDVGRLGSDVSRLDYR